MQIINKAYLLTNKESWFRSKYGKRIEIEISPELSSSLAGSAVSPSLTPYGQKSLKGTVKHGMMRRNSTTNTLDGCENMLSKHWRGIFGKYSKKREGNLIPVRLCGFQTTLRQVQYLHFAKQNNKSCKSDLIPGVTSGFRYVSAIRVYMQ